MLAEKVRNNSTWTEQKGLRWLPPRLSSRVMVREREERFQKLPNGFEA